MRALTSYKPGRPLTMPWLEPETVQERTGFCSAIGRSFALQVVVSVASTGRVFDVEPETSTTTTDQEDAKTSYGVEFALVLARMIKAAREDPAQLRSTIYELARVKLRKQTVRGNIAEEQQAMRALEIAIQGVERFSRREEELDPDQRALPRSAVAQIGPQTRPAPPVLLIEQAPKSKDRGGLSNKHVRSSVFGPLVRLCFIVSAILLVLVFVFASLQKAEKTAGLVVNKEARPEAGVGTPAITAPTRDHSAVEPSSPPLPTVYGVYAISNGQFNEIYVLPGQIPDKRVAISAPISTPSRTILADGKISFVVFRRDVATSAPDRVEVRVIAKITRAMTFDGAGKSTITSVGDTWSVRSISYPLRVAPMPGNPEMLALKSEDPDFVLPAGRYAIVVKGQGYDFTIAGTVTDPSQCLEKVEAANGSFYAECRKP
jgi:hypothetical protein